MVTLVLGGARSGKSAVAERIAASLPPPVTYLAAACAGDADEEWAARVAAHRSRRPTAWRTVEATSRLPEALDQLEGTVLVDGLGTWVAACEGFVADCEGLCSVLRRRSGDVVVVSDEVGMCVHPSSKAGRLFRDALGLVNQAVAAEADEVLLVVAGRVLSLGELAAPRTPDRHRRSGA